MQCLDEQQALAFVANQLAPDLRASLEDHVDDCDACRRVLAELVKRRKSEIATDKTAPSRPGSIGTDPTSLAHGSAPDPTPIVEEPADGWTPGTRIGRYVVLARIGRGGMGTVFRAEDVELGRAVALKRLHADADHEARARLLREARSAAQLQHPNVVTVHEVGEHAGTPFLAMELVDGVTLTAWLRERTRTWREIVGTVAQAGRGLAAAHERGLVHRDFKPDNILVDRSGRARVADFGLARAGGDHVGAKPSRDERLARMTATGSVAGTPAYMAPELVEGAPPDARSDQYAFAITLYEALRGQHPFEGTTAAKLWLEMAEGRIRAGGRRIPAWLDKHVRRGLAVMPAQRWPDIASFLAAIEKPPRRKLWVAAGVGAVAIASTIALVATREPAASGPSCDAVAAEYDLHVSKQDLAIALPDPQQRELATKALDKFTANYRKALRDSCKATRAGTQSAAMGDKRSACLEHASRRAWFVTSDIMGIDERPGLAKLLDELPDATACSDPEWLTRAAPLPVSKEDREAIYLAESNLVHAGKVRDEGRLDQASMLIAQALDTAKRLDDRSLAARANMAAAEIAKDRGDSQQAELDALEAWTSASAGGDKQLTLRAQLAMLGANANNGRNAFEGFSGLGKVPESAEGANLIMAHGDALMSAGKFKEGEAEYRRAQTMREKVLPAAHLDRALGLLRLGAAIVVQKRAKEALPILQQANAAVEAGFPPLRREAIDGVRYLAMVEDELGHRERALELYREVHKRRLLVLGPSQGLVLDARADVARALDDLGYEDEAINELEAVVEGFQAIMGGRTVNGADARVSLANKLISVGRFAEADAQLAKALPMIVKGRGEDSPYTMVADYTQVRSWLERPKPIELARATQQLDRIEPVFEKLFGRPSQPVAATTFSRARIAAASNDARRADELLAAAIAMIDDDHRSGRAEMELFRATVLWKLGRRDDARASAEAAAKDYDAGGAGFAPRANAARAWLAKPSATMPVVASARKGGKQRVEPR